MSNFYPAPIVVHQDDELFGGYYLQGISELWDELSDSEPDPDDPPFAHDQWVERERVLNAQERGTALRLQAAYNLIPNDIPTDGISNEKLTLLTSGEMVLIVEALSKYGIELDECLSRSDGEVRSFYSQDAGDLNEVFKMLRRHGVKC